MFKQHRFGSVYFILKSVLFSFLNKQCVVFSLRSLSLKYASEDLRSAEASAAESSRFGTARALQWVCLHPEAGNTLCECNFVVIIFGLCAAPGTGTGRVFSNHACLRMLMFPLGLHFVLGLLLGAELCLGTEACVQMIPDAPETFLSSLPILFSFWCRFYF